MLETLAYTALTIVACAVAVKAVMWRLTYGHRRNPTPAMKRGEASPLWLLILVLPVLGVVAVWTGHTDAARLSVALTLGAPWMFCKPEFWMSTAAIAATTEGDLR